MAHVGERHSLRLAFKARSPNGNVIAALSGMLLSEPAVGEHFVCPAF
jgi:hypothetical protein